MFFGGGEIRATVVLVLYLPSISRSDVLEKARLVSGLRLYQTICVAKHVWRCLDKMQQFSNIVWQIQVADKLVSGITEISIIHNFQAT